MVYDALDEIKGMMDKLIRPPPSKQLGSIVGTADVLQTFKIADVGKVAGCRLLDGYIRVGCNIRILRGNLIVYEGKLRSLRSVKSVVEQVDAPNECGVVRRLPGHGGRRPRRGLPQEGGPGHRLQEDGCPPERRSGPLCPVGSRRHGCGCWDRS